MNNSLKKAFLLIFVMITMIFRPIVTLADIIEKDNLKVKLQLEGRDDTTNEVKGKITISNVGIRSINGIEIKDVISTDMKIKEKNIIGKVIGTINPGESVTEEVYLYLEDKTTFPGQGDDTTIDADTGVNKPYDGQNTTITDGVNTGDSNIILTLSLIIIIATILIVILSSTKNINIKKLLSIFLSFTLITSLIQGYTLVNAATKSSRDINVKETIELNNNLYEVELVIKYDVEESKVTPSGKVFTRGEWIDRLINTLGISTEDAMEWDEYREYPFNDIENSNNKDAILYAYVNNILEGEGDSFRPDEPATREFVALTSIKGLGFAPNKNIECNDTNEITYSQYVEVAVSMGIILLEDNYFYPQRAITESEVEYITSGIKGILTSENIDENYDNKIEYLDGVIELDNDTKYEIDGENIIFDSNDTISKLSNDDIFVLPNKTAYKVVNITKNNGKLIIETSIPEIEETLDYVDVQGYGTIDMSQFIPDEGISIINDDEEQNKRMSIDSEGGVSYPGAIKLAISQKIDSNLFINGSVAFELKEVLYKADIDVNLSNVDINNVFLKFDTNTKLIGSISVKSSDSSALKDGIIKLGKVPIVGIPGVTIYAQLAAEYTVEGKVSLVCSVDGEMGVQVLNNRLRAIKTLKPSLTVQEIETSIKVGPKVSGLLELCANWDLIDFSGSLGGNITATKSIRDIGMICIDSKAFVYAEISALDIGIIGKWLKLSYTWNIWNKSNSPFKIGIHVEDFNIVPSCTYGKGILTGTVALAGNRNEFIKDSLIQVYNSNNVLVAEANTDEKGKYSIKLKTGEYRIKISKPGYITFNSIEKIVDGEEKVVETYLIVNKGIDGETGIADGVITNAVNGTVIPEITMNIREGWNTTSGEIVQTVTTDNQGKYKLELPLGNYTIEMIKDGYITKSFNIYVASVNSSNQNNTLVPTSSELPSGELRIVLTWGEKPYDLDSHLLGPTVDGEDNFHISYYSKEYYENEIMYADLDLDDTDSYGPETTTVYTMNSSGKYKFYVHDYSNRYNDNSLEMSNSGAKVDIYKGDQLCATYNIETSNEGVYWHVFDYDAETNRIIPVNKFTDEISYEETGYSSKNLRLQIEKN